MLNVRIEETVKTEDGVTTRNRVAVETPRVMDAKKGKKRNDVLDKYSVSDQINAIRKAILTGDHAALQAMDDDIEAIINAQ
jgi:hypothetical protein